MSDFRDSLNPEQQAAYDESVREQALELAKAMRAKGTARSTEDVSGLNVRISEKTGAICFYGWGRFPVTIYAQNLLTLLGAAGDVVDFMRNHAHEISWGRNLERGEGSPFDAPTEED